VLLQENPSQQVSTNFKPTQKDYQEVYSAIAKSIWDCDDYDDGSYAPVLLRLAWHCSGTYDKTTNTGGSNGATMRFHPESSHGANAGLKNARDFLEPIHYKFPWISYGDLWTLGGVCALQEMSGPIVEWRPGRQDRTEIDCTPDGRLPDGSKEQNHIRQVFGRMGFNDQEMVALIGGHAVGRCHHDRSGFEGPWTFSPTMFTNEYFRLLLGTKWNIKDWEGPKQYEDTSSKSLMMLPTDMALMNDAEFRVWVIRYAEDDELFFGDFSRALTKLLELGVPFEEDVERMRFKPSIED
jgi:cytochrome c peroxidase